MNRTFFTTLAILAVALSIAFPGNAQVNNCNPPLGGDPGKRLVLAWGRNDEGQLGIGTFGGHQLKPVQVQNLSGVANIAAGASHSLAVKDDGTLWAWGLNSNGQLGDGTTDNARSTPVQVQNLSGVKCIAGGFLHSLALKDDGTVWAWGWNLFGQLGDGTTDDRSTPVQVQNLSGITAIGTTFDSSLALKSDGTLWAWGLNGNGQLGDGTTDDRSTPVQVQNLIGVTTMAAGTDHSLALKSDSSVWAWGSNAGGWLGDGTTTERHTPVQVISSPLTNAITVKAIAAGLGYSLAVNSSIAVNANGTVLAWGFNLWGQLGDGTTMSRTAPVPVVSGGPLPRLSGVTAIVAHDTHTLALRTIQGPADSIVQAWGLNDEGQLGDGSTTDRPFPVQVSDLNGVKGIAVGQSHSLAIAPAPPPQASLTVVASLVHPAIHRPSLFNLMIDGVVRRPNVSNGSTGPQLVGPGNHTVSETGGTGTLLGAISTVIGGDCAADGTVSLGLGEHKTCTITNYDNTGPCGKLCCEPGDGTQGCLKCSAPNHPCQ